MSEFQRIIDDIRSILYSDVDPMPDELEKLVSEYVTAIEEANRELRACEELLHRGHREEAIQQCDSTKLLERVGILDFPEREEWSQYVSACGLPTPPEIEIDRAAELNEAYAAQQPLEPLLRQHRLHALARSPLPVRIALMRYIEKKDADNPVWNNAITEFEGARHRQIEEELSDAINRRDVRALAALERELRSSDWRAKPPASLVKKAVSGHTQFRQSQARAELHRLQRELNDAYADFDAAKGRSIRSRWNALAEIAQLGEEDAELLDMVGPAFDWLHQLDVQEAERADYEKTLRALQGALNDWAPYETLKTLAEKLARFEDGIPEIELTQLNERFAYLRDRELTVRRWKVVGAVAAVLLLAGVTALGVVLHLNARKIDQAVSGVESLRDKGDLEGAWQLVEKLEGENAGLTEEARWIELRRDVERLLAEHRGREQQFDAIINEALQLATRNPTFESLDEARRVLGTAENLAETEDQINRYNQTGRDIRQAERDLLSAQEERFLEEWNGLQDRYVALNENASRNMDELEQLAIEIEELLGWDHVSDELKDAPDALRDRIGAQVETQRRYQTQDRLLAAVTEAVGDESQFESRLREARDHRDFEGSPQALAFDTVLKNEVRLWRGMEAWSRYSLRVASLELASLRPDQARSFIQNSEELLEEFPGYPGEAELEALIERVEPIAARANDDGERMDRPAFEAIWKRDIVDDVYAIETTAGDWYYSSIAPRTTNNGAQYFIEYFENSNLDTVGASLAATNIANLAATKARMWLSPQSVIATAAMGRPPTDGNWEEAVLDTLALIVNDGSIDPTMKFYLLTNVVNAAVQFSAPLQSALETYVDRINNGSVDLLQNFLNPTDPASKDVRKDAAAVLRQLPAIEEVRRVAEAEIERMTHPRAGRNYKWVGWLNLDHDGAWQAAIPAEDLRPTDAGTLYVVYATSETGPPIVTEAGVVKDGKAVLNSTANEGFLAGRPLWFVPGEAAADNAE